tara:strand:- start:331 stop:543 length:213 start_codon:yes stop_codon:yes gene_type:complete
MESKKEIGEKVGKAILGYFSQTTIVCGNISNERNFYGVSFNGLNPEDKDFFECESESEAIRLSERINKLK